MMSAMEESYYLSDFAKRVSGAGDDWNPVLYSDDGIYDDDDDYDDEDYEEEEGGKVNDTLESYDMPDPQAWLKVRVKRGE